MKRAILLIFIILLSLSVFALNLDQMTSSEQKDFLSLEPESAPQNRTMSISKSNHSAEKVVIVVVGTDLDSTNFSGASVFRIGNSNIYSVVLDKSVAQSFLLSDSVKRFSILNAKPLLNYSNPTTNAPTFYSNDFNGIGASICIDDTGINTAHSAFSGKNIQDLNCLWYEDTGEPYVADDVGHGTHVAGIIASQDTSYKGIAYGANNLINAKGFVSIFPICLLSNLERCFSDEVVNKPDVVNNSWGSTNYNCDFGSSSLSDGSSLTSKLVDWLISSTKKVFVFAAGNSGPSGCSYVDIIDSNTIAMPADTYNAISVASMDTYGTVDRSDDTVSLFSSRGPTSDNRKKPDISAPGATDYVNDIGITSTDFNYPDNNFTSVGMYGTSMAAPHVTGAVALVTKAFNLNWLQSKALLLNSAEDVNSVGWDKYSGWGYLDLNKAFYEGNNTIFKFIDRNYSKYFLTNLEGNGKVTLVWDRYCDANDNCSNLTNLDLNIYDSEDNFIATSSSTIDNVEQVVVPTAGLYKIKVKSQATSFDNGFIDENFALASSGELIDYYNNAKISNYSTQSSSAQFSVPFVIDVSVLNDTNSSQDFNLSAYDFSTRISDINSFTLPAFTRETKQVTATFLSTNTRTCTLYLSVPASDQDPTDNNVRFSVVVDGNDSSIDDVNLSSYDFNTLQTDQVVDVNAIVSNLFGPTRDVNVSVSYNNIIQDYEIVNVAQYSNSLVSLTALVKAGDSGDKNITVQVSNSTNEYSVLDNSLIKTVHISKIDAAILSVSASPTSGVAKYAQQVTFQVQVKNSGTDSTDFNLLFYDAGILVDQNYIGSLASNATKTISFKRTFYTLSNDLNFVIVPQNNDYNLANNNYYLNFAVVDVNNFKINKFTYRDILPYSAVYRVLKDTNYYVDVNFVNEGTGSIAKTATIKIYDGNDVVGLSSFISLPGDKNIIPIQVMSSTLGSRTIKAAVEPIPAESSSSDNNYSSSITVDGNALRIATVSYSTSITKDTNAEVDVNVQNLGPAITSQIALRYTSSNTDVDVENVSLGANSSAIYTLHSQKLTSSGTFGYKLILDTVSNEYTSDNNLTISLTVPRDTNSVTTPPVGGGVPTIPKRDVNEESVSVNQNYTTQITPADVGAILTEEEKTVIDISSKILTSERKISNVTYWDSNGRKTEKTKISFKVLAADPLITSLSVIEVVPKSFAADASLIESPSVFSIRKRDPVIEFTVVPNTEVIYYVKQKVDSNKISDFNAPLVTKLLFKDNPAPLTPPDTIKPVTLPVTPPKTPDTNTNKDGNFTGGFLQDKGTLFLIIVVISILICASIAVIFVVMAGKKKKQPSLFAQENTSPFSQPKQEQAKPVEQTPLQTPKISSPSSTFGLQQKIVHKVSSENVDAFFPIVSATDKETVVGLNQGTSFVRSTMVLESKTKMNLAVMKAFKKGTKSVTVLERLPLSLGIKDSDIDSRIPFRVLQGNIVEFTIDPTQDVAYYINKVISPVDLSTFSTPIISKVVTE